MSKEQIYEHRKNKFLKIGRDKGFVQSNTISDEGLRYNMSTLGKIFKNVKTNKFPYILGASILLLIIIYSLS